MTSRTPKRTDDEIEAEFLATRDDPSAWEVLPLVPPSRSPRPEWATREKHLQLAARFHVLSVLHFRGAEASLLATQPDDADIVLITQSGEALTIDVKTITRDGVWYVDRFTARKHHFVVFVDYSRIGQQPDRTPDVYVVRSETLRDFIERRHSRRIAIDELDAELRIRNAWQPVLTAAA